MQNPFRLGMHPDYPGNNSMKLLTFPVQLQGSKILDEFMDVFTHSTSQFDGCVGKVRLSIQFDYILLNRIQVQKQFGF